MTQALGLVAAAFGLAFLAALVMARLVGRAVWLGALAAAGVGVYLYLPAMQTGAPANPKVAAAVFFVASAFLGWVLGSLIGRRLYADRASE